MVVDEFSRIIRLGHRKLDGIMIQLLEAGVSIMVNGREFLHDEEGIDDAIGLIIAILQGSKDYDSLREKAKLVSAAWAAKRGKVGEKVMTKQVVRWCEVVDGVIKIIPARAKVVRDIFQWYLAGEGVVAICNRLNEAGVATWSGGRPWHVSYAQKILSSPAVIGTLVMKDGETAENYYPRVISDEDFARATHIREQRQINKGFAGRTATVLNPFRGLLTCCGCGSKLVFGNGGQEKRFYICKDFGCRDYRKRWSFRELKKAIVEAVEEFVYLDTDPHSLDTDGDVAVLEAKIGELRQRQEELIEASLSVQLETWKRAVARVEQEIADLETQVASLRRSGGDAERCHSSAEQVRAGEIMTPEALSQAMRNLLSGVEVDLSSKKFELKWLVKKAA